MRGDMTRGMGRGTREGTGGVASCGPVRTSRRRSSRGAFPTPRRTAGAGSGPAPLAATLAALAMLVGATSCAARGPVDAAAGDRRIGDEIREIAADVEGLDPGDLGVESRDGVVILTGVQSSWEAVSELLERVTRVRGVREVVNRIRVIRLEPTSPGRPRVNRRSRPPAPAWRPAGSAAPPWPQPTGAHGWPGPGPRRRSPGAGAQGPAASVAGGVPGGEPRP